MAVAEECHVHRAAARLGLAQPALTQQIKALEREMKVQLLARVGRGIVLTEAGQAFHREVRQVLSQVEHAVAVARDLQAGRAGVLRIGFTESASFHPSVTQSLQHFRAAWPDVECRLLEQDTEALVSRLERADLDVAFVRPPLRAGASVVYRDLIRESMVVAVANDHPLAGRGHISITDLANQSLIAYPRRDGPGLSDAVLAACHGAGFSPRIAQRTPQLSSTINFVAAGVGIAVVPHCMRLLRSADVTFLPLADCELHATLGIAHRGEPVSRVLAHFLDIVPH